MTTSDSVLTGPRPTSVPSVGPVVAELEDEIVSFRRDLHRHPELSYEEYRTTDRIVELLSGYGLSPVRMESTGAYVDVGEGPVVLALRADIAQQEFKRGGAFQAILLRYMQALLTQTALTGVCNRHHTVDRQLSRWLLLVNDRIGSAEIKMTQEQIAHLLGVRREGITEAARRLQDDGCIRYSRGLIQVLERECLLARSCECYSGIRNEYDRLLGSDTSS